MYFYNIRIFLFFFFFFAASSPVSSTSTILHYYSLYLCVYLLVPLFLVCHLSSFPSPSGSAGLPCHRSGSAQLQELQSAWMGIHLATPPHQCHIGKFALQEFVLIKGFGLSLQHKHRSPHAAL